MKKRRERKSGRNRRPRGVRVVVEYRFRAYSPPDDLEALLTDDCRVTYADAPVTGTNLADVRADLEERGFELHGAHPIKTHWAGRYSPTWREVWVSNGGRDSEQRRSS